MTVISSAGRLLDVAEPWYPAVSYGSVRLYDGFNQDYATLYRTQPNVRTCVEFLARNIAQLGLHVYERMNDTDRKRLVDHPLARLLAQPLPAAYKLTTYRMIEALVGDLGVYFNAYWLKIAPDASHPVGLLRLPPALVSVKGGLAPSGYELNLGAQPVALAAEAVVHFRGYNPESAVTGLSPLETLRRVLAEEHAAGEYREGFWQGSARIGGFVKRPKGAGKWSDTARERFRAEFEALYTGKAGSGRTAILEEDMEWEAGTFNAQESEYMAGRKLAREECARAYHIPLPMVGILDNATFSNITEQHKNLYQDTLGPWCTMIEQDVMLQLLPEFGEPGRVYVEFNIAEKLAGSFEEQAAVLQTAVGRPWMAPDEARGRLNLPSMGGQAAELGVPMNLLVGDEAVQANQGQITDPAPAAAGGAGDDPGGRGSEASGADAVGLGQGVKARRRVDATLAETRREHERQWAAVLERTFRRQQAAVVSQIPKGEKAGRVLMVDQIWDQKRWDRELQADLFRLNGATALVWARWLAKMLAFEVDEARMQAWLSEHSLVQAQRINGATREQLAAALAGEDARGLAEELFGLAIGVRALEIAVTAVTAAASFGSNEAALQGGLKMKTWKVNSTNPRELHATMNGETVPVRERFSNGQMWPGDPAGGADNCAGCQCSVIFKR